MNAPDSSPPPEPQPLAEPVRARLQAAIAETFRLGAGADEILHVALREAAAEARGRGLRPEELVITLKALLDDVPAGSHGLTQGDQLRIRERIVSACIAAYFKQE